MSTNLHTRAKRLHRLAHELPENQAVQAIRAMLRVVRDEGVVRGIAQFEAIEADAAMSVLPARSRRRRSRLTQL